MTSSVRHTVCKTTKGKNCTLDFNRCVIFQSILLIWILLSQVAGKAEFLHIHNAHQITSDVSESESDKHSYRVIQSFSHWPIEIKVHNMRTRYDARHEKNGKRMLMNGVFFFFKPRKVLKGTNALGFSLRTTFAQQIESAVTYSAPSNTNVFGFISLH